MKHPRLLKLADFIEKIPPDRFHMGFFHKDAYNVLLQPAGSSRDNNSKMCGCVVGHACKLFPPQPDDTSWLAYARNNLLDGFRSEDKWRAYDYLFSSEYSNCPENNTPQAAASRIRLVGETGYIPDVSGNYWLRPFPEKRPDGSWLIFEPAPALTQ